MDCTVQWGHARAMSQNQKKILLVGASGTLGQAVRAALTERGHQVVTASRKDADLTVDITDPASIAELYRQVGRVDAVASAAGTVPWKTLGELSTEDVRGGFEGKVLSQVELVRQGLGHVADGGSYTLITGILSREPIATGTVASLANGAVEAFVRAAAVELPAGQRINAVSPTVFEESLEAYGDFFPGFDPVPVARAARAYVRSVEGLQTGQVYRVE
ncbi:short chain dehydrogenase [Streptomyces sp. NPDC001941]|uniref:short chain dehydrogenase n=1 Tax=Streptomyces sp. NPDC001941 TaxID=3154659 RepID=UPI0033288F02